jgi:hypothetical protein
MLAVALMSMPCCNTAPQATCIDTDVTTRRNESFVCPDNYLPTNTLASPPSLDVCCVVSAQLTRAADADAHLHQLSFESAQLHAPSGAIL